MCQIIHEIFARLSFFSYFCSMFKEYKFTIFAVIIFGIIIAFGLKGAAKQQETTVERLEIPLPLKNTSEQILYRIAVTNCDCKNASSIFSYCFVVTI